MSPRRTSGTLATLRPQPSGSRCTLATGRRVTARLRALLSPAVFLATFVGGVFVEAASLAHAAPLSGTPLVTNNLQGATSGQESKWATLVEPFLRNAELVGLQEVGATPPGTAVDNVVWDPGLPGRAGYVQHTRWRPGAESYEVYFLQTDANGGTYVGGRKNIAIVTHAEAHEVAVVRNRNGGRPALGVRFDKDWYFTFHAQASGGQVNEGTQMLSDIAARAKQVTGRQWTVMGNFNTSPSSLENAAQWTVYRSNLATIQGGAEVDFAISSRNLGADFPVLRLNGGAPERYAVGIGDMRVAAPAELRVMPLGDSITFGYRSTTGNGYRGPLYDALLDDGFVDPVAVHFVGSLKDGTMREPYHEGHSGWKIADIAGAGHTEGLRARPNVVLIHAGTNDMNKNYLPETAPERLASLIDQTFMDDPTVTVLVATLVRSTTQTTQDRIATYNAAIPQLVYDRYRAGRHIALVDMGKVSDSQIADGLHPNDAGYAVMADAFHEAIDRAILAGWVAPPAAPMRGTCATPVWRSPGKIASGPGSDDPPQPGVAPVPEGGHIQLADVDGDGRSDYLSINPDGSVAAWLNPGPGPSGTLVWRPLGLIAAGVGSPGSQIQLADINDDGRADYLDVRPNGSVAAWLNGGADTSARLGWLWTSQGQIASGVGDPGAQIRFADLNADGRADYLDIHPNGSVSAWYNGGAKATAQNGWLWTSQGQIALGVGDPGEQIQFADITGDGRADYLDVQANGSVSAWLNRSGTGPGGIQWAGQGEIASGVGAPTGSLVTFADLNADGKADYLSVFPDATIREWENGGADPAAHDGWVWIARGAVVSAEHGRHIAFADIDDDGKDDYLVVHTDGSLTAWLNGGASATAQNGWLWTPQGIIASGVGDPGDQVQLADINGDGRADYLDVFPNGAVAAWLNGGASSTAQNGWLWIPQGIIASGVGDPGPQIRLADINGDGKADYLDVAPNGAVTAWLNGGANASARNGWSWIARGKIASGVGDPGEQIQFASVMCGNGKADYLDVLASGALRVWLNGGANASAQNGWLWTAQGTVASGVGAAGQDIQFADLDGDGRADYLYVAPNGATEAWLNWAF